MKQEEKHESSALEVKNPSSVVQYGSKVALSLIHI